MAQGTLPPAPAFTHMQSANFEQDRPNIIFIDNRFTAAFNQVMLFYDNGFFAPETTKVIFRYYSANFTQIHTICDALNIPWFAFGAYQYVPPVENKFIIYPFNSAPNSYVIANRTCKHALLMHGESNKLACVKPLARIYDYLLIAGDLAQARLLEFGIMTSDDVKNGRLIRLGATVMGDIAAFRSAPLDDEAWLAYVPTWEGGNDEENLCSLDVANPLVANIAHKTGLKKICLRLHPHTGERLHPYRQHVIDLITSWQDAGFEIGYVGGEAVTALENTIKTLFPDIIWFKGNADLSVPTALAIADVSALETLMDAKSIPAFVIVNPEKEIAVPKIYWELKSEMIIMRPDCRVPDMAFLNTQTFKNKFALYQNTLSTYTNPALIDHPPQTHLAWLNQYVHANKLADKLSDKLAGTLSDKLSGRLEE